MYLDKFGLLLLLILVKKYRMYYTNSYVQNNGQIKFYLKFIKKKSAHFYPLTLVNNFDILKTAHLAKSLKYSIHVLIQIYHHFH